MATFKFTDQNTGAEIKLEAADEAAAQKLMASAPPDALERAISASNPKAGLTPRDITAILGGQGYKAETSSALERGAIGVGDRMASYGRGAQQLLPDSVQKGLGLKSDEQLGKDEANARELFQQVASDGFGAAQIGQVLPDVLAFAGGGSVAVGLKTLVAAGGLTGAAIGALKGATSDKERVAEATVSGLLGAAGPLLGIGTTTLLTKSLATSRAAVNILGAIAARAKGSTQAAVTDVSRALSSFSVAENAANNAAKAAAEAGQHAPGVRTAAVLATRAQNELAKIIGAMEGDPAAAVARNVAMDAYNKAFTTTGGQVAFNPATAWNRLAPLLPRNLTKLGAVGDKLAAYRGFMKTLASVDDANPAAVKSALSAVFSNPEAEAYAKAIERSTNPQVKSLLLDKLAKMGELAATGGLPVAAADASGVAQDRP